MIEFEALKGQLYSNHITKLPLYHKIVNPFYLYKH
nr:MAG TPA: hypothetical protein [Caudoviricetes sp.]